MKKYQIVFTESTKEFQAGYKAPDDIAQIAQKMGFERLIVNLAYKKERTKIKKIWFLIKTIVCWIRIYMYVECGSVILLQCPMSGGGDVRDTVLKRLRNKKSVRFVSVVHDVYLLRYKKVGINELNEFKLMLLISDQLIVHNKKMKNWFIQQGYRKENIIELQIFDYLTENKTESAKYSKKVIIAGNLDLNKTAYLSKLNRIESNFLLYGPNYNTLIDGANIEYKGAYPPDQLPEILNEGFGLVWDGPDINTCSGEYGDYLRYNNPHKLSLYLVSKLPVFVWRESAEADFVIDNNLGFTISSLKEIDNLLINLTPEYYKELTENVCQISNKLIHGEYTKNALSKALEGLE